jgi:hypothetical protein
MRAIAREVSENNTAYKRQREICALFLGLEPSNSETIDDRGHRLLDQLVIEKSQTAPPATNPRGAISLMRWWRWNGMLGINSRSYQLANEAIKNGVAVLDLLCKPLSTNAPNNAVSLGGIPDDAVLVEVFRRLIDAPRLRAESTGQEMRIELLRLIEQYIQVRLLSDSCCKRLYGLKNALPPTVVDTVLLLNLCDAGQQLTIQIAARDSSDGHDIDRAFALRSRLLMHESILAISDSSNYQVGPDGCSAPQEAMRLLLTAEVALDSVQNGKYWSDKALLEMHRAEVKLNEADQVLIGNPGAERTFRDVQRTCAASPSNVDWRAGGEEIRKQFLAEPDLPGFAHAKSLVEDAMRFLARAEAILLERRQNVWWTSWLFERWLRAIAMAVWATLPERNTPIPFLGLEAAPRKTMTKADALFEDSQRMIRLDAYRLGTIVEAYRSCANALRIRLMLDAESEEAIPLPERQGRMYKNLCEAVQRLQEVSNARKSANKTTNLEASSAMDNGVQQYITEVLEQAQDGYRGTLGPLY